MRRTFGQLLAGILLFTAGIVIGILNLETTPIREFEPQPDMVSLQDPETVTDAFLLACTLQEYEGAAWLADPTWVASHEGIESVCLTAAAPPISTERLVGMTRQTAKTAFVEWIWFETDNNSVVAYFLLEQRETIGWQIVGLTVSVSQ